MMYYSVFGQPAHLSLPITVECESFEDLCAGLINPETYPNKQSCPGIKLAVFNGKRNHENLEGFCGVELDYDDGKMRPEEVSVILSYHNIKHFIYTTPTHQPFQPRFRVLVPFSDYWDMDVREDAMRKLTHLLNDSFAAESRTASQFYYYGQVEGVLYETFYGDGEFIDLLEFNIPESVVVPKTLTPKSVDSNKPAPVHTIRSALTKFSPDSYPEWANVGQRLKGLGDEGFELWVEWSRKSPRHNENACLSKWDDLGGDRTGYQALFEIAEKERGWINNGDVPADVLARVKWEETTRPKTLFSAMCINDDEADMEKELMDEVYVMDEIALRGNLTVIYAASNTGKTLLTLHCLIESVKAGRIKGEDVFYINADDGLNGIVEKLKILKPHGIQVYAPNRHGFKSEELMTYLSDMSDDEIRGKVLVLDTLTKFTNLMEKNKCRDFVQNMRDFAARGLTVIMLAHTNKTLGLDGKPIPEGTADMRNNVDCTYVMSAVKDENSNTISVTFNRDKYRGSNSEFVKFTFERCKESTYKELLDSVFKVSDTSTGHNHKHKSSEYSSFDADVVLDYIEAHPGGITLKELTKYGADNGIKHIKNIVEDNMHRLKRVGDVFKLE